MILPVASGPTPAVRSDKTPAPRSAQPLGVDSKRFKPTQRMRPLSVVSDRLKARSRRADKDQGPSRGVLDRRSPTQITRMRRVTHRARVRPVLPNSGTADQPRGRRRTATASCPGRTTPHNHLIEQRLSPFATQHPTPSPEVCNSGSRSASQQSRRDAVHRNLSGSALRSTRAHRTESELSDPCRCLKQPLLMSKRKGSIRRDLNRKFNSLRPLINAEPWRASSPGPIKAGSRNIGENTRLVANASRQASLKATRRLRH